MRQERGVAFDINYTSRPGAIAASGEGFTMLAIIPTHWEEPVAYLTNLFVEPKLRGTGVSKKLLEKVIEEAVEAGAERIETTVNTHDKGDMERTQAFFLKNGFKRRENSLSGFVLELQAVPNKN